MINESYPQLLAVSCMLPPTKMLTSDAIYEGYCSNDTFIKSKFRSVCTEYNDYPIDMALRSALCVTKDSSLQDLEWIFYSHIHYQGQPKLWSPASYLQHHLSENKALPVNINQGCNGLMLTIDMACSLLKKNKSGKILCSSGDRFNISKFRRWSSDYSIVYGDGASSILLGFDSNAIADILAIESISEPTLESMHRYPFGVLEDSIDLYDIRATKKRYILSEGIEELTKKTQKSLQQLWEKIMVSTGVKNNDINYLILPHLGEDLLKKNYLSILNFPNATNNINEGLDIGHLGCSDPLVGLTSVVNSKPASGELAVIIGAGAGFSWSLCLMRFR